MTADALQHQALAVLHAKPVSRPDALARVQSHHAADPAVMLTDPLTGLDASDLDGDEPARATMDEGCDNRGGACVSMRATGVCSCRTRDGGRRCQEVSR
jgi:hypothetical protein